MRNAKGLPAVLEHIARHMPKTVAVSAEHLDKVGWEALMGVLPCLAGRFCRASGRRLPHAHSSCHPPSPCAVQYEPYYQRADVKDTDGSTLTALRPNRIKGLLASADLNSLKTALARMDQPSGADKDHAELASRFWELVVDGEYAQCSAVRRKPFEQVKPRGARGGEAVWTRAERGFLLMCRSPPPPSKFTGAAPRRIRAGRKGEKAEAGAPCGHQRGHPEPVCRQSAGGI